MMQRILALLFMCLVFSNETSFADNQNNRWRYIPALDPITDAKSFTLMIDGFETSSFNQTPYIPTFSISCKPSNNILIVSITHKEYISGRFANGMIRIGKAPATFTGYLSGPSLLVPIDGEASNKSRSLEIIKAISDIDNQRIVFRVDTNSGSPTFIFDLKNIREMLAIMKKDCDLMP